jgi:hypothetical protein
MNKPSGEDACTQPWRGPACRPFVSDELLPPVEIRRKCRTCQNNLGVQNPGDQCDSCKHTK